MSVPAFPEPSPEKPVPPYDRRMPALVHDPDPGVGDGTGRRRASRTGLAALAVAVLVMVALMILFPQLVLFLPNMLM